MILGGEGQHAVRTRNTIQAPCQGQSAFFSGSQGRQIPAKKLQPYRIVLAISPSEFTMRGGNCKGQFGALLQDKPGLQYLSILLLQHCIAFTIAK